MKTNILLFSILLGLSSTFLACKDTEREAGEVEILEERDPDLYEDDGAMDGGFGSYDANRDNQWDENEFSESYQAEFSGYDADISGNLNNEEFSRANFKNADSNRDNNISREEWQEGYLNTYGEYASEDDFTRFDIDENDQLSETEWNQGFSRSNWFRTYDRDQNNSVSMEEWISANFKRWDRNNDGVLDRQEFQTYNRVMMGNNSGKTDINSRNNSENK
ncbi:EF-hand domain-containing protein [Salinimicrobium xinjiangense]|uniref:hypothetical protein n=1 Tax=Salinimicrobium xinjiangense TaxID=438596 RepID=UPI0004000E88|nr:hypothetical protein [Salinimicrobium xinjiangense]